MPRSLSECVDERPQMKIVIILALVALALVLLACLLIVLPVFEKAGGRLALRWWRWCEQRRRGSRV